MRVAERWFVVRVDGRDHILVCGWSAARDEANRLRMTNPGVKVRVEAA